MKRKKPKYAVGMKVYCRRPTKVFDRGYEERFFKEPHEIVSVNTRMPIPMYKVQRLDRDPPQLIKRAMYEEELQPFYNLDEVYKIEKVLKKKKVGNRVMLYVKWAGYDQPTWINEQAITETYNN